MSHTQLLCTFCRKSKLQETIDLIKNTYVIIFEKIFILKENIKGDDITSKLMCTYNIEYIPNNIILPNTISLHRKKETNTLYTINAINDLIRLLNDQKLDKTFPIPWQNYKNCLLLSNEFGFKKIETAIHTIIKLKNK